MAQRYVVAQSSGDLGWLEPPFCPRRDVNLVADPAAGLAPEVQRRIRAAAVTISASVIIGMAMFGGIIYLPFYLQVVKGYSPTESGLALIPMVIGPSIGAAVIRGADQYYPAFDAPASHQGVAHGLDYDRSTQLFARMRREEPIAIRMYEGRPFYDVTRYADLVTVTRDAATYSNARGMTNLPDLTEERPHSPRPMPEHRPHRGENNRRV